MMLRETVVEKEIYEATKKAKRQISDSIRGIESYDVYGLPVGEEDSGHVPEAAWDGDPVHRDLGPPQAETIPLEDAPNPFPMLEPPVEF